MRLFQKFSCWCCHGSDGVNQPQPARLVSQSDRCHALRMNPGVVAMASQDRIVGKDRLISVGPQFPFCVQIQNYPAKTTRKLGYLRSPRHSTGVTGPGALMVTLKGLVGFDGVVRRRSKTRCHLVPFQSLRVPDGTIFRVYRPC